MKGKITLFFKKYWQWVLFAAVYWAVAFLIIPHDYSDYGGDSAQYIMIAESALSGHGYVMSNYPGEPVSFLYPPVFPTILMPVLFFWGRNFYALYFLTAFLGFAALGLAYRVFKEHVGAYAAYLAVFCSAINWHYCQYAFTAIRSEIAYLFFVVLTLLVMEYYRRYPESKKYAVFLGLSLAAAYFTRYIGITLVMGVMIGLLAEKKDRRKIILPAAVFLVPFLAWNIAKFFYHAYTVSQVSLLFSSNIYSAHADTILQKPFFLFSRFFEGVNYYGIIIGQMIFSAWPLANLPVPSTVLSSMIVIFAVYGFFTLVKRRAMAGINAYFLLYSILILLWPAREGARFLVPVIPFFFLYLFAGITTLVKNPRLRFTCILAILASCLLVILVHLPPYRHEEPFPRQLTDYKAAGLWLKGHSGPGDIIIARKPTILSFYSGRKSIVYPYSYDTGEVWRTIVDNHAKYIVVDDITQQTLQFLVPAIMMHKKNIKPVYTAPGAIIFEVI
jgi:hypothetical protein